MAGIGIFVLPGGFGLFGIAITLVVIGVILNIIGIGWTDGACCCSGCGNQFSV